jgi:alpha-galactosidase
MGFCSWPLLNTQVSEQGILQQATNCVALGLDKLGWTVIQIDDCWASFRDANGNLVADTNRFPSGMPALIQKIHGMGLKVGLFFSLGTDSIGGMPGSEGHWAQDATNWANLGVDYFKIVNDTHAIEPTLLAASYREFIGALQSNGISVFVQGSYHDTLPTNSTVSADWMSNALGGYLQVGRKPSGEGTDDWGIETNDDYGWVNFYSIIDSIYSNRCLIRPGHFFNPGGGMGGTIMNHGYENELGIASLLSAELIALSFGTDSSPVARLKTNTDLIAIDQDRACNPPEIVGTNGNCQIWVKLLSDGSKAVGLMNRSATATNSVTFNYADIKFSASSGLKVLDIWTHASRTATGSWTTDVEPRELKLYRVTNLIPQLTIAPTATNGIVALWDAAASGFVLQHNVDIYTPDWVTVTNAPTVDIGDPSKVAVSLPMSGARRFYRLSSEPQS